MHTLPRKPSLISHPPPSLPKKPSYNVLSPNNDRYRVSKSPQDVKKNSPRALSRSPCPTERTPAPWRGLPNTPVSLYEEKTLQEEKTPVETTATAERKTPEKEKAPAEVKTPVDKTPAEAKAPSEDKAPTSTVGPPVATAPVSRVVPAAPAPRSNFLLKMSAESDTVLRVVLYGVVKKYKAEADKLRSFGVLQRQLRTPKGDNDGGVGDMVAGSGAGCCSLDFGVAVPHLGNAEAFFASLDRLLRVVHRPGDSGRLERDRLGLRDLWHIAHMNCTLRLDTAQINMLAIAMAPHVTKLICGNDAPSGAWEMALGICLLFHWTDYYARLAGHLAYICAVMENAQGKTEILKPLGGPLLDTMCGDVIIADIVRARAAVMTDIIKTAEDGLRSWITGLACYGCHDCKIFRIAGLSAVLIEVGLFPHKKPGDVSKSIQQICDEMDEDKALGPMSRMFVGKCQTCDREVPRSYLFPVEDVLTSVRWDRRQELIDNLSFRFGDE